MSAGSRWRDWGHRARVPFTPVIRSPGAQPQLGEGADAGAAARIDAITTELAADKHRLSRAPGPPAARRCPAQRRRGAARASGPRRPGRRRHAGQRRLAGQQQRFDHAAAVEQDAVGIHRVQADPARHARCRRCRASALPAVGSDDRESAFRIGHRQYSCQDQADASLRRVGVVNRAVRLAKQVCRGDFRHTLQPVVSGRTEPGGR